MKRNAIVIGAALMVVAFALGRAPKSDYQFTGEVVEVDKDIMVVKKGEEKWEFALDKDTKTKGPVKKGSKVTVKYLMKATAVEAKQDVPK